MLRRNFIADITRLSLVTAAGNAAGQAYRRGRETTGNTADLTRRQLSSLTRRIDSMQERQKKLTRALLLTAAVSTGIDLSLFI